MPAPDLEFARGAVVAAVDDSRSAREALRFAADLVDGAGRSLHVVLVWNFVTGHPPGQGADGPPSMPAWQAEAERRLAALVAEELGDPPGVEVRPVAVHGNAVPTLLAVSELAKHIIVGSRGRGGFTGLLLGSTTAQLIHHARCPLTVVREGTTGR